MPQQTAEIEGLQDSQPFLSDKCEELKKETERRTQEYGKGKTANE